MKRELAPEGVHEIYKACGAEAAAEMLGITPTEVYQIIRPIELRESATTDAHRPPARAAGKAAPTSAGAKEKALLSL
jgi:DNA-binding transcriptional regulator YdaS (Cro superfamily)